MLSTRLKTAALMWMNSLSVMLKKVGEIERNLFLLFLLNFRSKLKKVGEIERNLFLLFC